MLSSVVVSPRDLLKPVLPQSTARYKQTGEAQAWPVPEASAVAEGGTCSGLALHALAEQFSLSMVLPNPKSHVNMEEKNP